MLILPHSMRSRLRQSRKTVDVPFANVNIPRHVRRWLWTTCAWLECYRFLLSSCLQILSTETTRKNAVIGRHTWRIPTAMRSSYRRTTISIGCSTCNAWTSFALFLPYDLVAASVLECLSIFLQVYWMAIRFMASRKLLLGKSQ